ncbi:MAG: PEP-CTERM sorting domain-containing protein [Candidatus Korobacteraceae bacterium]
MTKTLRRVLWVLALFAFGWLPTIATAGPITYTETFTASGTVNGSPFDGTVMFSLTSDTTLVFGNCDGISGVFCTPNTMATVSIQGFGAGTFTDLFNVFVNQNIGVAGFTDDSLEDIVDLANPAFTTYDLKSPIGPLNTTYFFTDNGVMLGSSLGTVVFDSFSGTPTFQASEGQGSTPEPGSFVLFGSGLFGLSLVIRRKLRL